MTWILGSGVPFGYGALISDVRATFPDGRFVDGVQKVHVVGNGLVAGFAGSIWVGFYAISRLREGWSASPGSAYPVERVAQDFGQHWRRFYPRFKPELRALGCELMLAGISPGGTSASWPRSAAAVLRGPDFRPQIITGFTWASIGSGSQHKTAAAFANADNNWDYLQSEVMNPDGIAWGTALSVACSLDVDPLADVSPKLQVAIARGDRQGIGALRREVRGAWTVAGRGSPDPGEFFTTWEEFRDGLASADASTAVA